MDTQNQLPEETDSIADALNAAFDHIESGGDVPDEPVLEIDQPDDALPDPLLVDGDKPGEQPDAQPAAPDQPAAETQPAQPEQSSDAPEQQQDVDRTATAPSSWTREAAGKWADLPDDVKAEIHRRETDYHRGIEQYRQAATVAQEVQQAIAPFMQNLQAAGVHPLQAINHLLGVEHTLRNGSHEQKAQKLAEIARDYGIDLQAVAPLPQLDPQVQAIIAQNRQLQQFQQTILQQQQQAVMSNIDTFRANPENVHYEAVKDIMAQILINEPGKYETMAPMDALGAAYQEACWRHPDIRQTLLNQQRTEAQKQAAEQQRKARAQSAAGGVRGAANSKATALSPDASLRDTLTAAMDGNL